MLQNADISSPQFVIYKILMGEKSKFIPQLCEMVQICPLIVGSDLPLSLQSELDLP